MFLPLVGSSFIRWSLKELDNDVVFAQFKSPAIIRSGMLLCLQELIAVEMVLVSWKIDTSCLLLAHSGRYAVAIMMDE